MRKGGQEASDKPCISSTFAMETIYGFLCIGIMQELPYSHVHLILGQVAPFNSELSPL